MKAPHLLLASGNPRKLKENLVQILDQQAILAIEAEILSNVAQLYLLGRGHYNFAVRQGNRAWRQKISRLYYGAYNASRAARLLSFGEYSAESGDHKKIEKLPSDFPSQSTYSNRLSVLREDRNLCDYDHTASIQDLILTPPDAVALVTDFLSDSSSYLRSRGVSL
jgi:hypothetical protein